MFNQKINKFIFINAINFFLFVALYLASKLGEAKWVCYAIFLAIYFIYLLRKDSITIIKYQISFLLISSMCLDVFYFYSSLNMPMEVKYVVDIIAYLLCFKIIINIKQYKSVLKDPLICLIIIASIFSCILCLINNGSFVDLFNGFRIYYRFIPVYIVLSLNRFEYKTEYYLFYCINILAFILEVVLKMAQDHRNGIFGATGSPSSSIFMLIMLTIIFIQYINKKKSLSKIIFVLIITLLYFTFAESKAYIFITISIIYILAILSKGKYLKKLLIGLVSIMVLLSSISIITILFPNFTNMFKLDTMNNSIESYLLKNNNEAYEMGRVEGVMYVSQLELNTKEKEFVGLGLGSALQPENLYYSRDKVAKGRKFIDFKNSSIYSKYGEASGYYLTSVGVLFIETGFVGILALVSLYIIMVKKIMYIIKYHTDFSQYLIGMIGISTIIASIFPILYGGGLLSRNLMFIIFVILGKITYTYNYIKYTKSNILI